MTQLNNRFLFLSPMMFSPLCHSMECCYGIWWQGTKVCHSHHRRQHDSLLASVRGTHAYVCTPRHHGRVCLIGSVGWWIWDDPRQALLSPPSLLPLSISSLLGLIMCSHSDWGAISSLEPGGHFISQQRTHYHTSSQHCGLKSRGTSQMHEDKVIIGYYTVAEQFGNSLWLLRSVN